MIHTKELPSTPAWAPIPGSTWQHVEGGRYGVIGCGLEEATLKIVVIYFDHSGQNRIWTRPLANFMERFKLIANPNERPKQK